MIVIFDTETTDLVKSAELPDHLQPKIIEFYGMQYVWEKHEEDLVKGPELHLMIDPGEAISETITKITGIKNDDLTGKPTFPEVLGQLQEFFLGATHMVGHNVTFDADMLLVELKRLGRQCYFPWPPRRICTVEATQHKYGRRLSLTDLHKELFDEAFDSAHRAKSDVEATARCFEELLRSGEIEL